MRMSTAQSEGLRVLISESEIRAKITELAGRITQDYGNEEILLVGVLKGSFLFLTDLCKQLGQNIQIDFVQVSSYGDQKSSSGIVRIRKDLDINIEDKNVLIVEDIVDTGATLTHLRELLLTRKPKSLKVVSLLSKPEARIQETLVEYVGFEIPNEFVVGYGLDYAERYRNLPYIAILHEGESPQ
jgi:hypoxanthine phosphoribosyltransferase